MEKFKDYLTKDGWGRDWVKTKLDAKNLLEKIIQSLWPTFSGTVEGVKLTDGFNDPNKLLTKYGGYIKVPAVKRTTLDGEEYVEGLYMLTLRNADGATTKFGFIGRPPKIGTELTYPLPADKN